MKYTGYLIGACVLGMLSAGAFVRHMRPIDKHRLETLDVGLRVDLNRDDAPTLSLLPGIGPTLAQHIIEEREADGPFANVDDLQRRVKRIGPAVVKNISAHVKCGLTVATRPAVLPHN